MCNVRKYRERAGLTRAEAAQRILTTERSLCDYELGVRRTPCDLIPAMVRVYRAPEMIHEFLRTECPLGAAFGYEVLNNINDDPVAILDSMEREFTEAIEAARALRQLLSTKGRYSIVTETDQRRISKGLQEIMDADHNAEIAIAALAKHIGDLKAEVSEHNTKMWARGYVVSPESRQVAMIGG